MITYEMSSFTFYKDIFLRQLFLDIKSKTLLMYQAKLWIEKTNDLVDIETEISRNLKGLGAIEIANAVRKKSLAGVETAIRFFETQPRRERELDR